MGNGDGRALVPVVLHPLQYGVSNLGRVYSTYTHSPDPSKQYAILRKIRGSRDQAIPGYFAPQEQIPWVRG